MTKEKNDLYSIKFSQKYSNLLSYLQKETGAENTADVVYAAVEYFAQKKGIDLEKFFKEYNEKKYGE